MSPDLDGRHEVSIGEGCAFTGIVIHELMHAIGKKIYIVSIGIVKRVVSLMHVFLIIVEYLQAFTTSNPAKTGTSL